MRSRPELEESAAKARSRPRRAASSGFKGPVLTDVNATAECPPLVLSTLDGEEESDDAEYDSNSDTVDSSDAVIVISGSKNNPMLLEGNPKKVITKPIGRVWTHINKLFDDAGDKAIFSCKYCSKKWEMNISHWKSKGSVTSNFLGHVQLKHKSKLDGLQKIGPMDTPLEAFLSLNHIFAQPMCPRSQFEKQSKTI
jgi:hypothetical protein